MSVPAANGMLVVGKIAGCHGIKGWVKIHSFTDPMDNFLGFGEWQLRRRGSLEPVVFDQGRRQGKGLVAHIKGVDDRNLAETFKGLEVLVAESQLPQLEEGDFYWRQLHGMQVGCSEGDERVLLGTVDHLIETGANDVLVIKASEGSVDDQERLVPYLPDDVVQLVDVEQGLIEINWFIHEE
jgi:16S rRNA processing protein RimM